MDNFLGTCHSFFVFFICSSFSDFYSFEKHEFEILKHSLRHGDLVLDPAARSASLKGVPVALTGREFDLLRMLLDAAGRVLTRRMLDEQLYVWGEAVGSNALEVHIHHLRRKLGSELIRTVRGVGYMVDEAPK